VLCSPFLGGGSVEIAAVQRGINVYGYDNFEPLVNFWNELLQHRMRLYHNVCRLYPLSKSTFHYLQQQYASFSKHQQAAAFYALNRTSFSGLTFQGGMSLKHPRFTKKQIDKLRSFTLPNFTIKCLDFRIAIALHPTDFLYLDPPYYANQHLYGTATSAQLQFDHAALAVLLIKRKQWLLSYNDCAYIRRLYTGHTIIPLEWNYGMNNSKKSNEILIFARDNK